MQPGSGDEESPTPLPPVVVQPSQPPRGQPDVDGSGAEEPTPSRSPPNVVVPGVDLPPVPTQQPEQPTQPPPQPPKPSQPPPDLWLPKEPDEQGGAEGRRGEGSVHEPMRMTSYKRGLSGAAGGRVASSLCPTLALGLALALLAALRLSA